jgi:hypothetical protein
MAKPRLIFAKERTVVAIPYDSTRPATEHGMLLEAAQILGELRFGGETLIPGGGRGIRRERGNDWQIGESFGDPGL